MNLPKLPASPIPRQIRATAEDRLHSYPVLTITGPRQSGKTTLARLLRPKARYASLEDPDIRAFATEDPRGFLADIGGDEAIIDEVQRVPDLLSYVQGLVDAGNEMGRFILTGSSQFELIESVTQSLAGRTALLTLQPFSLGELKAVGRAPTSVAQLLQQGLFPPIHDRPVAAEVWLQDYIATYVERDVRALMNIRDVVAFQRFVQLCAGRCGQLLNINSLAEDAGINRATAQSWLSVLQASHLVLLVQPWATNLSKRLIKTPKLYFVDSALAASLMGVRDVSQVMSHPLRGALFENWAIMELIKSQCNAGLRPAVYFLRDKQGRELDALVETGFERVIGVEIKSGATVASDYFKGLDYWGERLSMVTLNPWLIYGGDSQQHRERGHVVPWNDMDALLNEVVSTR